MPQRTYQTRREQLLSQMPNNSIAFLATNKIARRNNDADYQYRADSSFFYLTGFAEPEAALVLEKDHAGEVTYRLFCREHDKTQELWEGKRAGLEGAVTTYHADKAYAITDIDNHMPKLLHGKSSVYCRLADAGFGNTLFANHMDGWLANTARISRGDGVPTQLIDINPMIYEMRLIKSAHEIAQMKVAAKISAEAHKRAMRRVRVGMMEYALEGELLYIMHRSGCQVAYNSIVAGGENACILHYVDNNKPLADGELVLIDAGAEYQMYAADITRTFPVNGKFTHAQKQIYTIVLQAQLDAMTALRVGHGAKDYHDVAVKTIVSGLVKLGLLNGEIDDIIASGSYKAFFMHGTGHWLGMDVHDVGSYNLPVDSVKHQADQQTDDKGFVPRQLQAGMVVTVEPGIYIAPDNMDVPVEYRGIGIRIEDDVLITEGDPEVLTSAVPKTIEAIEALMAEAAS